MLKWSPDGQWISYISGSDLWLVTPDGSIKKKILSPTNKDMEWIWSYDWSPDSSQIAYIQTNIDNVDPLQHFTVSILDLESGKMMALGEYENQSIFVKWAPNGQYLILPNDTFYYVVEATSGKVIKIIPSKLEYGYGPAADVDLVTWSPNSQWFFQIHHGVGCAGMDSMVTGLDGANYSMDGGDTQSVPVWDKTGNYLYVVTRNLSCLIPTREPNERLLRFSLKTKQAEPLLSLSGTHPSSLTWSISISPDGRTLETHAAIILGNQQSFVILDLNSMSIIKYTVNLGISITRAFDSNTAWSSDNQHIVIFSEAYQPQNYMFLDHGSFYTLDIRTGKTVIISGDHRVTDWAVSPSSTNP